jgi:uncharacterized RDD family membrane protein YckC
MSQKICHGKVTWHVFEKQRLTGSPRFASRLWRAHNPFMTCTVCGKPYPCAHSRTKTSALLAPGMSSSIDAAAARNSQGRLSPTEAPDRVERERWRREVVSRVQQHRARRRRFDPSASLDLAFPAEDADMLDGDAATEQGLVLPPLEDIDSTAHTRNVARSSSRSGPLKIIRFPRQSPPEATDAFWASPPGMELADAVLDTPRILDEPQAEPAAVQMELLESFADIHLEPSPSVDDEALPPQPAPLWHRSLAGLMDVAIVLTATAMFVTMFVKLAETVPVSRVAWLYALAVAATIWLMFQYIFLVHGRGTPGMRVSGLELCNFAGRYASRFARRCRALATVLSGLSLGLGFAWCFVDEDTLGWHDRISGTYLRDSHQQSAVNTQTFF